MSAVEQLTYQEEFALSDALAARAAVLDRHGLHLDDALPDHLSEDERRVIAEGQHAAAVLVASYDPYAWNLVRQVRREGRGNVLGEDDLHSIAAMTMIKATMRFDARGAARVACENPMCGTRHQVRCPEVSEQAPAPSLLASLTSRRARRQVREEHAPSDTLCAVDRRAGMRCLHQRCAHERVGRRFATYCGPYVLRELGNAVHKASIAFTLPPARIRDSWHWVEVRENLRHELGREPSIEELSEATGLSIDDVEPDLPSRLGMVDIDEMGWSSTADGEHGDAGDGHEGAAVSGDAGEAQVLPELTELSDVASADALAQALLVSLGEEQVKVFMSLIGADLGVPRSTREVAAHLKIPRPRVAAIESTVFEAVRHPRTRAQTVMHLRALGIITS